MCLIIDQSLSTEVSKLWASSSFGSVPRELHQASWDLRPVSHPKFPWRPTWAQRERMIIMIMIRLLKTLLWWFKKLWPSCEWVIQAGRNVKRWQPHWYQRRFLRVSDSEYHGTLWISQVPCFGSKNLESIRLLISFKPAGWLMDGAQHACVVKIDWTKYSLAAHPNRSRKHTHTHTQVDQYLFTTVSIHSSEILLT